MYWTAICKRFSTLRSWCIAQRASVWIPIISALIAVLSLIANMYQIRLNHDTERVRTAMEVVARTRLPEFVAAYRTVIVAQENSSQTDMDYLMGEFDYLLTFYLNDLTNDCLIKAAVYHPLQAFRQVLDKLNYDYPPSQLEKIDRALSKLNATKCVDDPS